jgi:hypothetical protein
MSKFIFAQTASASFTARRNGVMARERSTM